MAKKKATAVPAYVAQVGLTNDKTGASFAPGDVVHESDFPAGVIADWLRLDPPALTLAEEVDDGSNG